MSGFMDQEDEDDRDLGMLERYLREGPANPATFNITASAVTLNQSLHANKVLTLNLASGMTLTLPFATGTQDKYTMVVQTAFTSNGVIKVGRSADTMIGSAVMAGSTSLTVPVAGTDDTLTLIGTTGGGGAGAFVEFTDIAANLWLVNARLVGSGVQADPFSATV